MIILLAVVLMGMITGCDVLNKADDKAANKESPAEPASGDSDEGGTSNMTTDNHQVELPEESLQKGDNGDAVQQLQAFLIVLGYPIEKTSKYDEKTVWAITDFQLQQDSLDNTGIYDEAVRSKLLAAQEGALTFEVEKGLPLVETKQTDRGSEITGNPYEILVLVNKHHALPEDFIPEDLVIPEIRFPFTEDLPKKQMRKVAADAIEEMFAAADKEGLTLFGQSGYRSYDRQVAIFAANVEKNGEEAANTYSARPGESEHQSGLTMDVTNAEVGFDLVIAFGDTPEGKWLQEHAAEYGFIIRYPETKVDITEYQYEPWHIRYVGKKAATEIMEKGISLEEYLDGLK